MAGSFEEGYQSFCEAAPAGLAAMETGEWIDAVGEEIDSLLKQLAEEANGKSIDALGGDLAEFWHAGTFNIEAVLNKSPHRAYVLRSHGFASVDVDTNFGEQYSLKMYLDAAASAKAQAATYGQEAHHGSPAAMRAIESGLHGANDPVYEGMKRLIPEDQGEDALKYLAKKVADEGMRRPDQVHRYKDTMEQLVTRVDDGEGVKSWALSKEGSRGLARDSKSGEIDAEKLGLSKKQVVSSEHIAQNAFDAGAKAAAIAAAIALAPVVLETISRSVESRELDLSAFSERGSAIVESGLRAFLTGSLSAGVTAILGKHDIEANPSTVALVVVIAVNAAICAWRVSQGEMTCEEMAEAVLKGAFVAAASTAGGLVGQTIIDIPVLGYMVGSLIGSLLGNVGYEAGKAVLLGLCVERGFTFFGLVEQDYALPAAALARLGIQEAQLDMVEFDVVDVERVQFEGVSFERCLPDRVNISVLRRGLISVKKVSYV